MAQFGLRKQRFTRYREGQRDNDGSVSSAMTQKVVANSVDETESSAV